MINISTEILSTHKSSFGDLQKYLGGTMKVPVGLEYDGGGGTSEKYSGRLTSDTYFCSKTCVVLENTCYIYKGPPIFGRCIRSKCYEPVHLTPVSNSFIHCLTKF